MQLELLGLVKATNDSTVFFAYNRFKLSDLMPGHFDRQEYDMHLLPYFEKGQALFLGCRFGGNFKVIVPPRYRKDNHYLLGKGYSGRLHYLCIIYPAISSPSFLINFSAFLE